MILFQKKLLNDIPSAFLNSDMHEILNHLNIEDIKTLSSTLRQWEKILRWERYIMPPEMFNQVSINNINKYIIQDWLLKTSPSKKWYSILKNDGNVYEHSIWQTNLIYQYAKADIEWWYIDEKSYEQLIVIWLIHDIWEILSWDITYDHKTSITEAQERENWERILRSLFADENKRKWLLEIYSINFESNHPLNFIFKIYEKFSYLRWAFHAYNNRKTLYNPLHLIHNVLKNQIKPLFANMEKIPSIRPFLQDHSKQIDKLFDLIDKTWFQTWNESEDLAFLEAQKIWNDNKAKN